MVAPDNALNLHPTKQTTNPNPTNHPHHRLAAYRAECDEGCQQAVRALEQELKALDMAVAAQVGLCGGWGWNHLE